MFRLSFLAIIVVTLVASVAPTSGAVSNLGAEAVRLSLAPSESVPAASAPTSWTGNAGWAVPSLGSDYLAIRAPRGTVVTICAVTCWRNAVVNDYGPSSKIRPARVADIAVGHWRKVCGLPASAGLCRVRISVVGAIDEPAVRPLPTGPATDVAP